MTAAEQSENFDEFESTAIFSDDQALLVQVDGFEGPLDLLLTLARNQKVDIAKISILKLADQYLEFIEGAKKLNLELAADYLVMAAWLAYLKSRLILPQEKGPDGEPTADEMATRLRWRLQRLDAMRAASTRLMGRERLDRDVFGRGDPEPVNVIKLRTYKDTMYDLLTAYATDRVRKLGGKTYRPQMAPVLHIEDARERLERMLGKISDWSALDRLLPFEWSGGARRRSAMASTLLACLELARDGKVEIQQASPFAEIFVRDRERIPDQVEDTAASPN
jgi:segregation and condensation protein A